MLGLLVLPAAGLAQSGQFRMTDMTPCEKWSSSGGVPHYGHDGYLYNDSTSSRMTVTCPQDTHEDQDYFRSIVHVQDRHSSQAVECTMYLHAIGGTWWSYNVGASSGNSTSWQELDSGTKQNTTDNLHSKVVCELPPKQTYTSSLRSHRYLSYY